VAEKVIIGLPWHCPSIADFSAYPPASSVWGSGWENVCSN